MGVIWECRRPLTLQVSQLRMEEGGSASYREDLKQLELRDVTPLLPSINGHGHLDVFQVLRKQRDEEDGPETDTTPDLVSWGPS